MLIHNKYEWNLYNSFRINCFQKCTSMNECYLKYQGFREHKKKVSTVGSGQLLLLVIVVLLQWDLSFLSTMAGRSCSNDKQCKKVKSLVLWLATILLYDVCAQLATHLQFSKDTRRERNLVLCEKKVFFQLVVLFSFNSSAYLADDVENEDADNESNCKVHHLILLTERKKDREVSFYFSPTNLFSL